MRKILNRVTDRLKDYNQNKTINLISYSIKNKVNPEFQKLYDLVKLNPNIKVDDQGNPWDESPLNTLDLRFSTNEILNKKSILISVTGFKYKNSYMSSYKSIKLSNEEKKKL
jgi:hypothetical protein